MHLRASRVLGATLVWSSVGATVAMAALPAMAQDAASATPDDRKQAAKDFAEGDRAFKDGDFRQAAESYERAYHRVPHHSALWNAARAWHRAGELSRAANLYTRYLREAPASARDRNSAQRALNELSSRLARLEIHATDVGSVQVDGQPADAGGVFVTPGAHVVEGRTSDGQLVRQPQTVQAGDVVSVALVPPAAAPPAPPPAPPPVEERPHHGWSPVVVYFEGAVTLALAGITVWSGFDTLQQKDTFDRSPNQNNLDVGKDKQTRTNLLIAATAGMGAVTALTAIVLVDWHARPSREKDGASGVQLAAAPGALLLRGAF
jgi:hypothetical protein